MNVPFRFSVVAHGASGSLSNKDYAGSSSDGYSNVFNRFIAAARLGQQSDLTAVNRAMRLLHALYKSSRLGAAVTVDLP